MKRNRGKKQQQTSLLEREIEKETFLRQQNVEAARRAYNVRHCDAVTVSK